MADKDIIKMMEEKGFELITDSKIFPEEDTCQYITKVEGNTAYSLKFKLCKKDEPNTHRDAGKLGDESHLHGLGVSPMSIEDEIKQELHKDYGGVQ